METLGIFSLVDNRDRARSILNQTISHLETVSGTLDEFLRNKPVRPHPHDLPNDDDEGRSNHLFSPPVDLRHQPPRVNDVDHSRHDDQPQWIKGVEPPHYDSPGFKTATGYIPLILKILKTCREHFELQKDKSYITDFLTLDESHGLARIVKHFAILCRAIMLDPEGTRIDTVFKHIKGKMGSPEVVIEHVLVSVIVLAKNNYFAAAVQPGQIEQLQKALGKVMEVRESSSYMFFVRD